MEEKKQLTYTAILKEELKTAMGCTEPIAIAYCAAYARKLLGNMPESCEIYCSGNIIKNVKAVTVPQTGGLKGIEAAAWAGIIGGDSERQLEVLMTVSDTDRDEIRKMMGSGIMHVKILDSEHPLHIIVNLKAGTDTVSVEIIDSHTGLGNVVKNKEMLHKRETLMKKQAELDYNLLDIKEIMEYADTVDLKDIESILQNQIEKNYSIAQEGLKNEWGAAVGKTILNSENNGIQTMAKAMAAAGSDARMNGCSMPVVINSGSGNQGLTASLPVIVCAKSSKTDTAKLMRALCVSNLVAIHLKSPIGKLSAYCGAVCAAAGAVSGIAYLQGASREVIEQTIVNTISNVGGMVCDGAKSSCAGKIATALECAFLGYELAKRDHGFYNGEGIVKENVEKTIASVGRMARDGMHETDKEILKIMV
jgi:L-cysteine desulfidase